jgi:hypothetical protein
MADGSFPGDVAGAEERSVRVAMMHHPSHHVLDLGATERWFERVFRRPSTPIATILSGSSVPPDFPLDYSAYTFIADVLFDSIDPKRFVIGGVQRYASIEEPHLKELGWYVDGMGQLYQAFRRSRIRVTGTPGDLLQADEAPIGPNGLPAPFHSVREDTGLRYQFYPAAMDFPFDPRKAPGWSGPAVSEDDPLGIVRCSHHTILTDRPERALNLVVGLLGGEVVHEGRDELRRTTSVYVHLAGSTLEYGVPDPGTPAWSDWATDDPNDTYHAITWQVADLGRTERHLKAQGVGIQMRSDDTIVTDPTTSLGIPWGFSQALTPRDPRGRR